MDNQSKKLKHVMQLRLDDGHLRALEALLAAGYAPTKAWVIRQAILREAARIEGEPSQGLVGTPDKQWT